MVNQISDHVTKKMKGNNFILIQVFCKDDEIISHNDQYRLTISIKGENNMTSQCIMQLI